MQLQVGDRASAIDIMRDTLNQQVATPLFSEEDAWFVTQILFVDQFLSHKTVPNVYTCTNWASLWRAKKTVYMRGYPGAVVGIHNYIWLIGLDKMVAYPDMRRKLIRQRGHLNRLLRNSYLGYPFEGRDPEPFTHFLI